MYTRLNRRVSNLKTLLMHLKRKHLIPDETSLILIVSLRVNLTYFLESPQYIFSYYYDTVFSHVSHKFNALHDFFLGNHVLIFQMFIQTTVKA